VRDASSWLVGLVAIALAAGLAPAARALTVTPNPFFVLPNEFDSSHAAIELVDVVNGVPTGGSVLAGGVDPGDVTLVLRADMLGDTSSTRLAVGIRPIGGSDFVPISGVGWIAGAGVDVEDAVLFNDAVGFDPLGALVDVGESYDLVFLSYDALAADGTLEIVVGVQLVPQTVGTATLVPEPGTAALLAAGLALFAGARGARVRR